MLLRDSKDERRARKGQRSVQKLLGVEFIAPDRIPTVEFVQVAGESHHPRANSPYPVMITTRSRSRFEYWVRTPPPEALNEMLV
jgi:hypothetical protein